MMKSLAYFVIVLIGIVLFHGKPEVQALSCTCGLSPCETPTCCNSGYLTSDVCGCCQVCAKDEGEICGGPWNVNGFCSPGLHCFRECKCTTVDDGPCVFPFKHKGVEHKSCINTNADKEAPWCATKVDSDGEMVSQGECSLGCPGTTFGCNDADLFNYDGICVSEDFKTQIEMERKNGGPAYEFINGTSSATKTNFCSLDHDPSKEHCRCASDIPNEEEGHCKPPQVRGGLGNGWCFLELIQDPMNPTENCYEDVQWSAILGRFWSNQACNEKEGDGDELDGIIAKRDPISFS